MNLSEALDAALPDIPRTRLSRKSPPRIDPDLIIREDVTDGEPIVAVYQRSTANLLRMKPSQWQLARLFDGVRSYEEIAAAMDCPVGTVRSRIFRAREAIDRRLREVFEGGLGRVEELG